MPEYQNRADLTHLKLAHNILTAAEAAPLGAERTDKVARAEAYAVLAIAEALGRIADQLERDAAPATTTITYDGRTIGPV